MLFTQKKISHETRVLRALKLAGKHGLFGDELARASVGGHRFGEYIRSLRADGHHIITERVKGARHKYYYVPERSFENE